MIPSLYTLNEPDNPENCPFQWGISTLYDSSAYASQSTNGISIG